MLDARKAGASFPNDNLTPRGIVLNLGYNCWVCFDPDLLRVAAVWQGRGVTDKALAVGSYQDPTRKPPAGQKTLSEPDGKLWSANGIYPGWQTSDGISLTDPRQPAPSPEEVGRGPIAETQGRFEAIRLVGKGVVLEYTVGGVGVRESWNAKLGPGGLVIARTFDVAPSRSAQWLVLGKKAPEISFFLKNDAKAANVADLADTNATWHVQVRAHAETARFTVYLAADDNALATETGALLDAQSFSAVPMTRWSHDVVTHVKLSTAPEAYVVDSVKLPVNNPWQRRVRPADIQFLPDGTGVVVTIDGDVWLARGLNDATQAVHWRRFASGLHEPMSVAIRDGQIYVFDRNGIWRLRDTNGDGEADVHELFSNAFAQTADLREFPSTLRLAPHGEFVIAKGGQQATTLGKHNGSVLRISADGRSATVLGYGFRQPNIGVNLRTGLVTASDQQGQYIPSTPLHIVRDGQFYGFLADFLPKEKYPAPIAEPLTWLPHPVNASALSQVWLFDAKLGPLNDAMVHIGFNRPELFVVRFNERTARPQAAVISVTRAFDFTPLNGAVNPADGQLYLAGFQVIGWGNVNDALAGIGRIRFTGAPVTLPREVYAMDQGVLLRFDVALDPARAKDPASYSIQTWDYQRTYKYGSPQYKADGTPGQDAWPASAAYLSEDGRSVFVAVPGMKPVMQLRVGWSLATPAGVTFAENAYTTPYTLAHFVPKEEGFGEISVDLTPRAAVAAAQELISADEGKRLAQLFGCFACHAAAEDKGLEKSGPTWRGLFGRRRPVFVAGKAIDITVDEAYVRESILQPTAKIAAGFEKGEYAMPSYAGVLSEAQVDSLILFIKTLR
ncbi:MAG: DUF6797 domain-containing protein [Opitutaceae bacterium]